MKLYTLQIPIKLPSKKNRYRIRMKGEKIWLSASDAVKEAQLQIAWEAKKKLPKMGKRLIMVLEANQVNDVDNTISCVFDGLEMSGRIDNDRDFEAVVSIRGGEEGVCRIVVIEMDRHETVADCLSSLFSDGPGRLLSRQDS